MRLYISVYYITFCNERREITFSRLLSFAMKKKAEKTPVIFSLFSPSLSFVVLRRRFLATPRRRSFVGGTRRHSFWRDVLLSEILRIHHGAPLFSGQDVVEVIDQPKTKKSAPPFDRKDVPNVHLVSRRHALLLRDISSDRRYASRDVGENAQVWTSSSSSSGRRE